MDAQDLVQDYTVDIKKLDTEIERLKNNNEALRQKQAALNSQFKAGSISATKFKEQMKQTSAQLKQNQGMVRNLIGALGGLSPQMSGIANAIGGLFSGPAGIITTAITAITSLYSYLKSKEEEADAEHKKRMDEYKKRVDDVRNYEMSKLKASGASQIEAINAVIKSLNDKISDQRKQMETYVKRQAEQQKKVSQSMVAGYKQAIKDAEKDIKDYQKKLEDARKQKVLDDLADEYKKKQEYEKNQNTLETDLQKRIQDLKILLIEDEKEQKIAKIQLEEKRQLEALDKEYKTATSNNKKLINQTKDYVKEYTKLQIKAIKEPTKVLDSELTSATEKMEKFLSTYTAHIADEYSKVALSQSALFNIYKNKIYEELYKTDYKTFLESLKTDVESYFKEVDVSVEGVSEKLLMYSQNMNDLQKNEIETMAELVEINQKYDKQTAEVQKEAENRLKTINDAYILEEKRFNEALEQSKADGKYIEEEWEKSRLALQQQRAQQQVEVANWANDTVRIIEMNRINEVEVAEYESNERRKEMMSEYVESVSSMFSDISSVFDALAETEEEGSKKSIALQRASAYMSMAVALAQGISKAVSSSKNWIEAIAAIASTTAALIVQFAKVKKLEKESDAKAKYAKGGYVSGPGSSTSDSIDAKLSNGESVMTAKATTKYGTLLSALNQSVGGAPITRAGQQDDFVRQLALAISSMPAPVVSVESIDRQRDVVRQVDVLSKL